MIWFTWQLLSPLRLGYQSAVLAMAQIWANKTRAILTTIGIIIGVASVTAVIAALTGLKSKVLADFETFGTNKIFIFAWRPEYGPKRYAPWWAFRFKPQEFDGLLEHCPSVARFTRIAEMRRQVSFQQTQLDNVEVMGIEPDWHRIENRSVIEGRPFSLIDNEQARPVCLVSPALRDRLRLDRDCIGQSIMVQSDRYLIVGVIEPPHQLAIFGDGGQGYELFIPFNTAWRRYRPGLFCIAASRSADVSEEARAELNFFLRKQRRLKPDEPNTFRLEVLQRIIDQFQSVALAITMVAAGVVGISLLVGGVGIMNIMLVSVSERTREIGLRKAVGARPAAILLQFLVEAVMICLFGGLIGILCGYGLTRGLASIPGAYLDKAYV
ncbi:MAG TPA: ABC transporter permease, partial [Tepidisphaeraceae bacterium]|nr:ABC transporter permease [Tepidisphaeraceae bacterium]